MVDFNISGNVYTYDGDFHTVNSISIVNPIEEFTEDDYTVTYTNTSADYPEETNLVSVKDAGSYRIDIKFKDRPDNPDKPFSKMYSARLNTSIMIINKQTVPFKAENTVAYYDGNVKKRPLLRKIPISVLKRKQIIRLCIQETAKLPRSPKKPEPIIYPYRLQTSDDAITMPEPSLLPFFAYFPKKEWLLTYQIPNMSMTLFPNRRM